MLTASVVFVLLRENCLHARFGEQRDSIRCSCDIKASIVALGETIRRFLVKKKKKESKQNHETRQTKLTQASEQLPERRGAPRGGGAGVAADQPLSRWPQVLLSRVQSLLSGGCARRPRALQAHAGAKTVWETASPCRSV